MPEPKNPDLKTFIEDPAFQTDRALIRGYMTHVLTEEQKATQQRAAEKKPAETIFDALFGYRGPQSAPEEEENVFDRAFSFRFHKRT